jgi:hypothetical protein
MYKTIRKKGLEREIKIRISKTIIKIIKEKR